MVKVSFESDSINIVVRASGHALFDKKGSDIVCASISVLIQSWYMSEKELCGADTRMEQTKDNLVVKVNNYGQEELLLFKSLVLSLYTLENQYPEYIRIEMEECDGGFKYGKKRQGKPF